MSINSLSFLLFLAGACLGYYLLPKKVRWVVLLIASMGFYLLSGLGGGLYLLAAALLSYSFGIWLDRQSLAWNKRRSALDGQTLKHEKRRFIMRRRVILAAALVLVFSMLLLFKYGSFFAQNINALAVKVGFGLHLNMPDFIVPLGISFYTFQTAAYLIDIYREKHSAQRNFLKYLLFVSFFPQMVQGPINRWHEMSPSLLEGNAFRWESIQKGVLRIMWGVLKKALVADALSAGVNEIYANYTNYHGYIVFFGVFLYCIQLYCDFSGGIDIVTGASDLFGVTMTENFKRPFFAVTISDFWRRWHISLGDWMRDYIFYPLSLSKPMNRISKAARRVLPVSVAKRLSPSIATLVVFLLVGVWQGPGWANIAYGVWNGLLMSVALMLSPATASIKKRLNIRDENKVFVLFCILRTNFLIIIGRCFSRAPSLIAAFAILRQIFTNFRISSLHASAFLSFGISVNTYLQVGAVLIVLFIAGRVQERGESARIRFLQLPGYVQFPVLLLAVFILMFFVYGNGGYIPINYVYE